MYVNVPCNEEKADKLPYPIVSVPLTHVGILTWLELEELAGGLEFPCRDRVCGGRFPDAGEGAIGMESRGGIEGQEGCVNVVEDILVAEFENEIHV